MFREECPEFLNIRLGCWCSNGGRVSRAVWILVTIFLCTICDGYIPRSVEAKHVSQHDLNLVKLRSSSHVSTTQIGLPLLKRE